VLPRGSYLSRVPVPGMSIPGTCLYARSDLNFYKENCAHPCTRGTQYVHTTRGDSVSGAAILGYPVAEKTDASSGLVPKTTDKNYAHLTAHA
jgi:hypothetical protein